MARTLRGNCLNSSEIGTSTPTREIRALKTVHATKGQLLAVERATRGGGRAEGVPDGGFFSPSKSC